MQAQRERFVSGAVERGVERYQADAIFDLLERFAEYGFNKSHAAAYALVAYQTAYMKANYPVEFLAATMTLDMGNTDKLAEFRAEAERLGIAVDPPSINRSAVDFEVDGNTIIYALAALKGVGTQVPTDDELRHAVVGQSGQPGQQQRVQRVLADPDRWIGPDLVVSSVEVDPFRTQRTHPIADSVADRVLRAHPGHRRAHHPGPAGRCEVRPDRGRPAARQRPDSRAALRGR